MKKLKLLITFVILISGITSCSDDTDDGYNGLNQAYITTEEQNTLTVGEHQKVSIKLTLSKKVNKDTQFKLKITSDQTQDSIKSLLEINPKQIIINADSRETSFTVTLKKNVSLIKEHRLKISLEPQNSINTSEKLEIVIKPAIIVQELSDKQKKLLERYKSKGIDLTPFLGKLNVKTTIHSAAEGYTETFTKEFTKTINGISIITLSDQSTEDQPVLKMTKNPMGMTEFFYYILKKETIENDEYWYGDFAGPNYSKIMKLINWNKTSQETFTSTLDGLKIKPNKTIDYIGKAKDTYGDVINVIPFKFSYSAWNRLKKLIDNNNTEAITCHNSGATPYPNQFINTTDITEDNYESGAFKPTTGTIDYEKGTMTFNFLSSHESGGDYLVITSRFSTK